MSFVPTLAYNIQQYGSYPNDYYVSNPLQSYFPANLGPIKFSNYLKYQKKPYNDLENFYLNASIANNFFTYGGAAVTSQYIDFTDPSQPNIFVESYTMIDFGDYSITPQIFLNTSYLRQRWFFPAEFNFFYATLNHDTNLCYGYLLYPNKLFLKPISLQQNGNNWSLTTNIGIALSSVVGMQSNFIDHDAADYHINTYLNTPPTFSSLSDVGVDSSYTLTYDLCACRTRIEVPVITFTPKKKPTNFTTILEPNSVLNPDSTFITFSAVCSNPSFGITEQILAEDQPDVWKYRETAHFNNSSVILSAYDYKIKTPTQTYQLFQTLTDQASSYALVDSRNCVLSATLFLNTSNLRYYNPNAKSKYKVHHADNSILGVNYIADSSRFKNNNGISGSIMIGTTPTNLKTPISITNVYTNQNSIIWTTKYPPHYYSYKTKLADTNGKYLDSNSLNFYLYSPTLNTEDNSYDTNQNSYYVILSSYITSDFNSLQYGLIPTVPNDYIKYTPVNLSPLISSILICTYGNYTSLAAGSGTQIYDLNTCPWIPVRTGDCLRIDYPYGLYGQTPISIRSSLSSYVAGQTDAFYATNFTLAADTQQNNGFFLDLEILSEDYNQIILDTSNNISSLTWPFVDLSNQNICWYYTSDNTLTGLNISLNIIDTFGDVVSAIQPYQTIPFNSSTYYLNVSGYGPNTLTIYLSTSNPTVTQPASINTNNSLFSYFVERQFAVTPLIPLNNLNVDRTICLQAQLPINNVVINIPSSYQNSIMYWTWSFDEIDDPTLQPISASYNTLSSDGVTNIQNNYTYSTPGPIWLLSSINLTITPPQGSNVQNIHDVVVTAHSDIANPSIIGSYTFQVDDFPNKQLLNADFTTVYHFANNFTIGDTSKGQNTITRSGGVLPSTLLYFDLLPSENASNAADANNGLLTWYYNNSSLASLGLQANDDNSFSFDLSVSSVQTFLSNVSSANIILQLTNSLATGWTSAHNVSAITYFYAIDPGDFTTPLQFNVFPQYGWLAGDSQITILDENTYTLIFNPSAYDNTTEQTQSLYLSANKNYFTEYNYQSFTSPEIVSLPSNFELADIGYTPDDLDVYYFGLRIGLTAFNQTFYPENMGINYLGIDYDYNVTLNQFNITSQTLSAGTFATSNYNYAQYKSLTKTFNSYTSAVMAYWKLDEANGDRLDSSSNGYTMTDVLNGGSGTPSSPGIITNGIMGNGTSYLSSISPIPLSGDFTINYWVYVNSGTSDSFQCFAGPTDSLNFNVNSNSIYYGLTNNYKAAQYPIEISQAWHMATLTRASGLVTIYLDATPLTNNNNDYTDYTSYFGLLALPDGSYVSDANNNVLDEIGIFNRALTLNEITYLFNYGVGITYPLMDSNSYTNYVLLSSLIQYNQNANKFLCAPTIIPYNDLYLSYKIQTSSIDLNQQNIITVIQTITADGPAVPVSGSITYYLSSQYWIETSTVPYMDGTYDLFTLTIGDPFVPLQSGSDGLDNFYLYAVPDIYQQIPSNVFDRARLVQGYTGNTDVWSLINV